MTDLVFKKTEKKKSLAETSMMIYSFVKTGKSSLASTMKVDGKEPLFISTEEGHSALDVYSQNVRDWATFIKVRDYILANLEKVKQKFSVIVIDLISDLDIFASDYICSKYKVSDLSQLEWGQGFALHKSEIEKGLRPLLDAMPIVFISHTNEKEVLYNGEKIKAQSPSMSKRTLEFVNGKCDSVGFIVPVTTKNDKAYITFKPTTGIIAGTRFKNMVRNFDIDYDNISKTYKEMNEAFIG